MSDLPTSTRLVGKGIFKAGTAEAEATFEVVWNTQYSSVIADRLPSDMAFVVPALGAHAWSLTGTLSDGKTIASRGMILNHMHMGEPLSRAEFSPRGGLEFGYFHSDPPSRVRYGLVGLFKGTLDTCIDGWSMRLDNPLEDAEATAKLSRAWGVPLDGMCLTLSHPSAKLGEYHAKAASISGLLSLATGNGVAAHKMVVEWPNHNPYERWRHQTGDKLGPGRVYPLADYSQFLQQALPTWESWSQGRQGTCRLAVEYINLSHTGYLDTRLFQIMQAWEFVAAAWGAKAPLSSAEAELKRQVKQTCGQWRKSYPGADPDGQWPGRLQFPFEWQVAKGSILRYAGSKGLSLDSLGVDLERLKSARDTVAHTGKLPDEMRSDTRGAVDLLIRAQNAMQLVLLLELGYVGKAYRRRLSGSTLIDVPMNV